MNNDRIDSIISILKENENLNYLKLYKTLRKKIEPKLSYRDFTSDLRKLEEKGWIKKEDSGIRGTKGKYYIADFGILCCDNGISLKECDIYEKSIYFLLFVVGWGIKYDTKELKIQEIKNVQLREDYHSISKTGVKGRILSNKGRIFGNTTVEEYSPEKITHLFNFLIAKKIFRLNINNGRYYFVNDKFRNFFNWCWGILYQYLFRIMFEYVYSFIRGQKKEEKDWLETIFDKKIVNEYEKYYHIKRSDRKKCINVKKSVQDEFKSITGSTLSKLIKDQVNMLAKEIEKLENEYFTKNAYKQYGFFINRVIQILFPQFIQKDDFVSNLKIKPEKLY